MKSLFLLLFASSLFAQTALKVVWTEQDPFLPRSGERFKYRVRLSSAASGVALRPITGAAEIPFSPLGNNLWEVELTAPQFVARDVYSRTTGQIALTQNGATTIGSNVIIKGRNDDMPPIRIVKLASDLQRGDYVVNVLWPSFFTNILNAQGQFSPQPEALMKRIYQSLGDDYDFVNIIVSTQMMVENRYHGTIKNGTTGIGQGIINAAANYGSAGRLIGFTMMPNPHFIDGADLGVSHEFGHQWVQFVKGGPFTYGQPHWLLSTMATGIMGWSDPVNSQGLSFACQFNPNEVGGYTVVPIQTTQVFNDFDLYLMGLIAPAEVKPQVIITSAQKIAAGQTGSCGGVGTLAPGQFTIATVQDLSQAAGGPRVPSSATSQKNFRALNVVISRDGLLSPDDLAYYEFMARRIEEKGLVPTSIGFSTNYSQPFGVATGGRAQITANLTATPMPEIFYGGVANAGSFDKAALGPTTVASLFGTNLATTTAGAATVPLPTSLGGIRVIVDGRAAPLFYVSPGQVNFQIPDRLPTTPHVPADTGYVTSVRVERDGLTSNASYIGLRATTPGIMTYGAGQAVATNASNQIIGPDNPAKTGEVITMYFVGVSNLSETVAAGTAAPLDRLVRVLGVSSVLVNGLAISPQFIGLTPGSVGLLQVNFAIPNLPSGEYTIYLNLSGVRSNEVKLQVAR